MSGTNPSDPTPQNAIWSAPEPQAVMGLNSTMTYGSSFQCASPVNFQVALGGSFQIFVDPVGFMKAFPGLSFPDTLDALFGGGAYGNIQLTLGTSAQLVMGRSYNIDLGPARSETHTQQYTLCKPVEQGLSIAIVIATIAYTLSYGLSSDDDTRAILTMVYQGLVQIAVDGILLAENTNQVGYNGMWRLLDQALFKTTVPQDSTEYLVLGLAELVVAVAIIVPPIMDSVGEKQLDNAKAQQAS
jgi:hypothetical protein